MNELEKKIKKLHAAQSEIPLDELKNICTYIESNRDNFTSQSPFFHLPKKEIGTSFPVRVNTLTQEIDIFLDRDRPFGQGQIRIAMRCLQYDREEMVVIKILETTQPRSVAKFLQDAHNLQMFQDEPGICPVYDLQQTKIDDHDHVEMIQKFYNRGSLRQFTQNHTPTAKQALSIIQQLLITVSHLHAKGALIQDLGPHNVLIHADNDSVEMAIGDLKMLKFCDQINPDTFDWAIAFKFAPPEYWKHVLNITPFSDIPKEHWQKMDMWGIGCCLWYLLSDYPLPWDETLFFDPVTMLNSTTEIAEPKDSESLEYLLWEMMREDPTQRIGAQEALKKLRLKY